MLRPALTFQCQLPAARVNRSSIAARTGTKPALTVDDMDEEVLAQARQAQERLIQAEEHAEAVRADFRRAVHRLIVGGSSPPDIAAALGLSDQQIHDVVGTADGAGRRSRGRPPGAELACTFCGRPQRKARKLIAGPGVYICDACVALAEWVVSSGSAAGTSLGQIHAVPEQNRGARCRFCAKRRDQVTGLAAMLVESGGTFAGPAAICVECLSLCNKIIVEELG
jgi:ClpX C4-type zinc finger